MPRRVLLVHVENLTIRKIINNLASLTSLPQLHLAVAGRTVAVINQLRLCRAVQQLWLYIPRLSAALDASLLYCALHADHIKCVRCGAPPARAVPTQQYLRGPGAPRSSASAEPR